MLKDNSQENTSKVLNEGASEPVVEKIVTDEPKFDTFPMSNEKGILVGIEKPVKKILDDASAKRLKMIKRSVLKNFPKINKKKTF